MFVKNNDVLLKKTYFPDKINSVKNKATSSIAQNVDIGADLAAVKNLSNYSDEVKIQCYALRAMGYSYKRIGHALGVSESTAHEWINKPEQQGNSMTMACRAEIVELVKANLASKAFMLSNHILSAISDSDVENASLLQKTTAASQLIDKGRLLDNKSTENIAMLQHYTCDAHENITKIDEDIERIEAEIDILGAEHVA